MAKSALRAVIAVILGMTAACGAQTEGPRLSDNSIVVGVTGSAEATPDWAELHLLLTTYGPTAVSALASDAASRKEIAAKMAKTGVEAGRLKWSAPQVLAVRGSGGYGPPPGAMPDYGEEDDFLDPPTATEVVLVQLPIEGDEEADTGDEWPEEGVPRMQVLSVLSVRVDAGDLAAAYREVGRIIDIAEPLGASPADSLYGPMDSSNVDFTFGVNDPAPAREKAVAAGIVEARALAAAVAAQVGRTVGDVLSVQVTSPDDVRTSYLRDVYGRDERPATVKIDVPMSVTFGLK